MGMPKVLAALDTPLSDDGERLDAARVAPLIKFLQERGVEGFFVAGSTGMGPLLSASEWAELVKAALAASTGNDMLLNVSAPSTRETVERIEFSLKQSAARNIAGLVVATPVAYRYEKRAVLQYFRDALEAASSVPVYLYRKLGDPWGWQEMADLAEAYENLQGVKDSATQMAEHLQLISVPGLEVYQGYEALIGSSVQAGGAGPVSGLATVLPEIVAQVTRAAAENADELWEAQERLTRVRAIVCGTNPYAAFKALLAVQGVPVGIPRRPFLPLRDDELEAILSGIEKYGVHLREGDR